MVEVGLYICSPHNFEHYLQFGEMNGSILDPARQQELSRILKHYLEVVSIEREKQWHTPDVLQYLRAVVLSGEASDAGMQEMRFALVTALPEYQDKFRMSLDPHFVGAFGAAQMARHIVQNPEFMRPQQDFVVPDEYVQYMKNRERCFGAGVVLKSVREATMV